MFYKIRVNGEDIGDFGHHSVDNIHLSVGGGPKDMYVFASAVCIEDGKTVHYDWLQKDIGDLDTIEISPSSSTVTSVPGKRRPMSDAPKEPFSIVCVFCRRAESEVDKIIRTDERGPAVCSDCVDQCNAILDRKV